MRAVKACDSEASGDLQKGGRRQTLLRLTGALNWAYPQLPAVHSVDDATINWDCTHTALARGYSSGLESSMLFVPPALLDWVS